MKEISKKIGERIKEAREEKGLTQKQLGEFLGYSPMGISYFEQGTREMKVSDLEKLAGFFNKPVSYFLATGLTIFRADGDSHADTGVKDSLDAFDKFLIERKKKK